MIFTKLYFNKEAIHDITCDDLVNFFKIERTETDKLEFKSYSDSNEKPVNKSEKDPLFNIKKTISAFLNSEGGLLIWGAPKGENKGKKEKVFKGTLDPVDVDYEPDSLINKISDSITPIPKGILIHKVNFADKFIYIIEVQKSEYSPHQFSHSYFMRIDGQTRIAPHHYVEALFRKIKQTELRGYIVLENSKAINNIFELTFKIGIFNLSQYVNDYDLTVSMECSRLYFEGYNNISNDSNVVFQNNGRKKTYLIAKKILQFGDPVILVEKVIYKSSSENLPTEINALLLLYFGSRYSLFKYTFLKLRFSFLEGYDLDNCIIESKDNQSRLGPEDYNRELQLIKEFCGR